MSAKGMKSRRLKAASRDAYRLVGYAQPYSLAEVPPELRGNVSGLTFTDELVPPDDGPWEPIYAKDAT